MFNLRSLGALAPALALAGISLSTPIRQASFGALLHSQCDPESSRVAGLTRDVEILNIHSHNDYWRADPLFSAITVGVRSVEADIWVMDSLIDSEGFSRDSANSGESRNHTELFVGHNEVYLSTDRTLSSLYLDPLEELLDQVNCRAGVGISGVFYNAPEADLSLLLDFKNKPSETYRRVLKLLEPLIEKDYLSYWDFSSGQFVRRVITVTFTGAYPLQEIRSGYTSGRRHFFVDAPLVDGHKIDPAYRELSTMASGSLWQCMGEPAGRAAGGWSGPELNSTQVAAVKEKVEAAHALGLQTRIWDTPNWPVHVRDRVWHQIMEDIGSDVLNADDLEYAAFQW